MHYTSQIETVLDKIPTPCYVCEEALLQRNLEILDEVQQKSGAKIILALKGFAMWSTFDLVKKYLYGATASGLWEAKLAFEEFGKEVHTYSPAFKADEIELIAKMSDHIVFNSMHQLSTFKNIVKKTNPDISIGMRVNPEYSAAPVDLYNPCGAFSRLGVVRSEFSWDDAIDGLHFHALCEESAESLESVLKVFEERFGEFIPKCKWINFGGGHHITKEGYNKELLIKLIRDFKNCYNVEVYLEPGEAVGWQTGVLVATVVDIVRNGMDIAILDTSAETHMPDVLAMPYRPNVRGAGKPGEKLYTYRLGGNSCLAGDIIGDYSFDEPLQRGQKLIFEDMIHYTFVKNTTFNGIRLPSLALLKEDGRFEIVKKFDYCDYKHRLS
ncbi:MULTISPECIES: carboxynorspermidine decarboxylase [unclassified Nitratiruptor]|uniref:carboxynorspermidine decarboxylase n=1 Tax=unclassified Nitratiruptor TaxID=2624044 RepID=UPI001914F7BA|nr:MULTISPECIES: carboxynorspermidine decarboxylase [unclassified Nitratiruptor]BCD60612.1 carboxynorspermidine decarboxylase [Nitratiruptor sp. YY08-10]BCD64543.1 carboxynorspermidine decarboxylase [Nitratiruptor sp. YY08-14]